MRVRNFGANAGALDFRGLMVGGGRPPMRFASAPGAIRTAPSRGGRGGELLEQGCRLEASCTGGRSPGASCMPRARLGEGMSGVGGEGWWDLGMRSLDGGGGVRGGGARAVAWVMRAEGVETSGSRRGMARASGAETPKTNRSDETQLN
jgi:hypothetical protein